MQLEQTGLEGLVLVSRRTHHDKRGSFSRLYSQADLAALNVPMDCLQVNHSVTDTTGTLRGMHFQYPPFAERKLVACAVGALWDVVVDLRPGSPTRLSHFDTVLSGNDGRSLLVPEGFAHGFMTLEPSTHVVYVSSQGHAPDFEDGLRYDDELVALPWPADPSVISDKDASWEPLCDRLESLGRRLAGEPR